MMLTLQLYFSRFLFNIGLVRLSFLTRPSLYRILKRIQEDKDRGTNEKR